MQKWREYWFAPSSLLDLGVGRAWLALVLLLLDGTSRFQIVGRASPELWTPVGLVAALGWEQPSPTAMQFLGWTTSALLVLAAVGLFTRTALTLLVPLLLVQEGMLASVGKPTHAGLPAMWAVMFFALAPCSRRFAIDAWLRPSAMEKSRFARWPIDLFYVVLASFYFSAGLSKLLWSGLSWADGSTLQYHLLAKGTSPGLRLAEFPWLCTLGSTTVLLWELSFPLGMIRRLRPFFLLAGAAFHLSTGLFLDVWFWPVVALYLLFVPWHRHGERIDALHT